MAPNPGTSQSSKFVGPRLIHAGPRSSLVGVVAIILALALLVNSELARTRNDPSRKQQQLLVIHHNQLAQEQATGSGKSIEGSPAKLTGGGGGRSRSQHKSPPLSSPSPNQNDLDNQKTHSTHRLQHKAAAAASAPAAKSRASSVNQQPGKVPPADHHSLNVGERPSRLTNASSVEQNEEKAASVKLDHTFGAPFDLGPLSPGRAHSAGVGLVSHHQHQLSRPFTTASQPALVHEEGAFPVWGANDGRGAKPLQQEPLLPIDQSHDDEFPTTQIRALEPVAQLLPATVQRSIESDLAAASDYNNYNQHNHHDDYDFALAGTQHHRDSPRSERSSGGIKVVFNNNPQFIIGREHGGTINNDLVHPQQQQQLTRRTRQPSSGFFQPDGSSSDDTYHPDESSLDESKVVPTATTSGGGKTSGGTGQQRPPCDHRDGDGGGKVSFQRPEMPPNMEQVDLTSQLDSPPPPPPRKSPAPPPAQSTESPPAMSIGKMDQQQQQQQRQQLADDDEQVSTPFEQIVKSGMRPPLRMVVSMRNKHGDSMKVPVNLPGSSVASKKTTRQKAPAMAAIGEPQQQQRQEQVEQGSAGAAADDNTPPGGDFFDPSIVRPFTKGAGKTRASEKPHRQKEAAPQPVATPTPTSQEAQEPQQQQQADETSGGKTDGTKVDCRSADKASSSDEQQQQLVDDGDVQMMMMPQLTQFYNKTFSSMFAQFRKALNEHMQAGGGDGQHQTQQQSQQDAVSEPQPQQNRQQQQQQQQDDQEDLMVAMLAANMHNNNNPHNDRGEKRMSMTVIKPPKGTSLQDAIAVHARQHAVDPTSTVAILHSIQSKISKQQPQHSPQTVTSVSGQGGNDASPIGPPREGSADAAPVAVDIQIKQSDNHSQGHTTTRTPLPPLQPPQMPPPFPSSGASPPLDPTDPDGFSSASSSSLASLSFFLPATDSRRGSRRSSFQTKSTRQPPEVNQLIRRRRAASSSAEEGEANDSDGEASLRSSPSSSSYGRHLEQADRLTGPPARKTPASSLSASKMKEAKKVTSLVSRKVTEKKIAPTSARKQHMGAPRGNSNNGSNDNNNNDKRRAAAVSSSPKEKQLATRNKKHKMMNTGARGSKLRPEDEFVAAASESRGRSREAPAPAEDEPDEDAEPDSSDVNEDEEEAPEGASSAPSASESEPGDREDDNNELGGDDLDSDSVGFGDSDDEPYNQGASSERDYNSPSFEIPRIDINPDTLRQKGCRTVLREVQEIPMNGLGVVQADGRPGSGYQSQQQQEATSASNQLKGLRVRRQAGGRGDNDNLINSRKVTSIVMTKECHFPNDNHAGNQLDSPTSEGQGLMMAKRRQPSAINVNQQQQQQQQANKLAASSNNIHHQQAFVPPITLESANRAIQQQRQQQQQQQQQVYIANDNRQQQVATHQAANQQQQQPRQFVLYNQMMMNGGSAPQQPGYQVLSAAAPFAMQRRQLESLGTPQIRQLILANRQQLIPAQQPAPQPSSSAAASSSQQQQQPSLSSPKVKRRSLPANSGDGAGGRGSERQTAADTGGQRGPVKSWQPNPERGAGPSSSDFYVGADSRRNEVVAQKLYKPPSADDPYHTLSYSSKTGADPDMDQDEDDGFVMDNEESRRAQHGAPQRLASTRHRLRGALTELERQALLDPNHDDTDPVLPSSSRSKQQQQQQQQQHRHESQDNDDDADNNNDESRGSSAPEGGDSDADESDSDLTDESSADNARRVAAVPSARRPGDKQRQQHQPAQLSGRQQWDRANSYGGQRMQTKPEKAKQQRAVGGAAKDGDQDGAPRFGKSFKFEHEIGRPQPQGLMKQLRELKPGKQGYMKLEVEPAKEQQVRAGSAASLAASGGANSKRMAQPPISRAGPPLGHGQRRPPATAAERRNEQADGGDEDADEDDGESEADEAEPLAAGHRRQSPSSSEDVDPDADPEFNPKEMRLPAHSKPKKVQKSFAYVHRDVPRKGSNNPDDFLVSYGRGNLQSEHEDYDSDRDHAPQPSSSRAQESAAAAASVLRSHSLQAPPRMEEARQRRLQRALAEGASGQQQQQQQSAANTRPVWLQPTSMRFGARRTGNEARQQS